MLWLFPCFILLRAAAFSQSLKDSFPPHILQQGVCVSHTGRYGSRCQCVSMYAYVTVLNDPWWWCAQEWFVRAHGYRFPSCPKLNRTNDEHGWILSHVNKSCGKREQCAPPIYLYQNIHFPELKYSMSYHSWALTPLLNPWTGAAVCKNVNVNICCYKRSKKNKIKMYQTIMFCILSAVGPAIN